MRTAAVAVDMRTAVVAVASHKQPQEQHHLLQAVLVLCEQVLSSRALGDTLRSSLAHCHARM